MISFGLASTQVAEIYSPGLLPVQAPPPVLPHGHTASCDDG